MTEREELLQFIEDHGDDPRVFNCLLDMTSRIAAGESMESIAASYGVTLEDLS